MKESNCNSSVLYLNNWQGFIIFWIYYLDFHIIRDFFIFTPFHIRQCFWFFVFVKLIVLKISNYKIDFNIQKLYLLKMYFYWLWVFRK